MTVKEKFDSLIYTDNYNYQLLSDKDKLFFDRLFRLIIFNGEINWSNEKLSHVLQEPGSTIEKRLKRVEEAGLIIRESNRQFEFGRWKTTDRIIRLNPKLFEFDFKSVAFKLFKDYIYYEKIGNVLEKIGTVDYDQFIKELGKVRYE